MSSSSMPRERPVNRTAPARNTTAVHFMSPAASKQTSPRTGTAVIAGMSGARVRTALLARSSMALSRCQPLVQAGNDLHAVEYGLARVDNDKTIGGRAFEPEGGLEPFPLHGNRVQFLPDLGRVLGR